MNFVKKHNLLICSLISLLLGAIVFVSFFGYRVINPTYIDWLFESHIDMKLYHTGWHYFRNSPWTFPIGIFDSISYPNQTSVLNTDSIPLFAIFFKLFGNIIPEDFQYFGTASVISYMLQSLFGMLIIRRFTKNDIFGNIIAIISGLFFVLMPSFVLRTLNTSVFIFHWVVLACFIPVIYKFKLRTNIIYYSLTGILSAAINPYLLAICSIIPLVFCIYNYSGKRNFRELLPFLSYCLTALITLYSIGAFTGLSQVSFEYLDECSFNLNSFLNSHGNMRFFDNYKIYSFRQIEGYAYFGIGIIILIITALIRFIKNYLEDNIKFEYKKEIIFTASLILISIILALSPAVTYGDVVLFEIPYPDFIINLWSIFRTTGRFIWIANYIILIIALGYVVKHFSQKISLIILICCLCIQIFDYLPTEKNRHGFMCKLRHDLKEKIYVKDSYTDKVLDKLYEYNDIKYVFFDKHIYKKTYGENSASDIVSIALNSRNKGIKFNSFYYARPVKGLDKAYENELKNPKNDDIFIFIAEQFDKKLLSSPEINHFYKYKNFYVARTSEIKGWEDLKIKKEDIIQK